MKPEQIFHKWEDAIAATTAKLDTILPESCLNKLLTETRNSIALCPGDIKVFGSGWGALEELRQGKPLTKHLDFGSIKQEQKDWADLLREGKMNENNPVSYLVSDEWFDLLMKAEHNWKTHYHLALNYFRRYNMECAENHLNNAFQIGGDRKYCLYLLANLRRVQGRRTEAVEAIFEAGKLALQDSAFIKEVLKMLLEQEAYSKLLELICQISGKIRYLPLIRFMESAGLAHLGQLDEAEKILIENGGLEIPDIREGENSTSGLYLFIQREKTNKTGKEFDPDSVKVPFKLDLRMAQAASQ